MTEDAIISDLTYRLATISDPPQAFGADYPGLNDAIAQSVASSVLAKFLEFLRDNAGFLPPKETVLSALEKAIDAALIASGRPLLAGLLGPALKRLILEKAGEYYDWITGVTA